MDEELNNMARGFYGFGSWNAPYWFIGPEPGGNNNPLRAKVWSEEFKKAELCDCKEFHDAINVPDWHHKRERHETPKLQSTWKKLMLLMMEFRGLSIDDEKDHTRLRTYQRDHWGRSMDETCVIELSGLSAKDSAESARKNKKINEECITHRISMIRNRLQSLMQSSLKRPELVVVYGKAGQRDWEKSKTQWEIITGPGLVFNSAVKFDNTVFVFAPHPNARGFTDKHWTVLGQKAAGL